MPGPCPCMSLQRGTMTVALADAVVQILVIILYVLVMMAILRDPEGKYTDYQERVALIVGVIRIIICILKIYFANRLYGAARDKNYRRCRTWLIISSVIYAILLIAIIVNNTEFGFNGAVFAASIIDILYRAFVMWVVWMFIREIRWEGGNAGGGGVTTTPYNPSGPFFITPQSRPSPQQIYNIKSQPATFHYPPPTPRVTRT